METQRTGAGEADKERGVQGKENKRRKEDDMSKMGRG